MIPVFKRKELLTPPELIGMTVEENTPTGESEGPVKDGDLSVRAVLDLTRLQSPSYQESTEAVPTRGDEDGSISLRTEPEQGRRHAQRQLGRAHIL